VRSVVVELVADESQRFVISGITRKLFDSISPRTAAAFCFRFMSLDRESYPMMKVTVGSAEHCSDLSVFLHHYDMVP
jgi:hypothetical protein